MLQQVFSYLRLTNVIKELGLEPESEMAGRLRARQIKTLIEITPLMMAANVANALIVTWALFDQPNAYWLPAWAAAICLVAALGILNWNSNRAKTVYKASSAALSKAARGAFVLGALWAVIPVMFFPSGDDVTRLLVCTLAAGMLGGGAMSLYAVPSAMYAFIGAIAVGSGSALLLSDGAGKIHFAVSALLLSYVVALFKSGHTLSTHFARSVVSTIESREKTETIGVLLKDFSESTSDWLWQSDAHGQLVHGSKEFAENLGTIPSCFCNSEGPPADFVKVKGAKQVQEKWLKREAFTDLQVSAMSGEKALWVSISGKPLFDSRGEFAGYRGVASNITGNKEAEERIAYLAHNDALTGLVNRNHFSRAIAGHLAKAKADTFWAVMFLDLDGFKLVNDSKGHSVGDQVLEIVAQRIKKLCGDHDVVARLGGDEFAILCRDAGSIQALSTHAEKLIESVSAPYDLNDKQALSGIGVSVGIAIGEQDGASEQELLHNADLALYRAKTEGKGTFRFFELEMDEIVRERRLLEQDLRDALAQDQFSLSFQPLVSADGKETAGFEALVRWNHPERGLISPSDFIPIAESMGLISDIGDWVLMEACRRAVNWPEHFFVAVNLSPQQFQRQRIIGSVTRAIIETGINPSRLELEVTEGLLMENTEEVTYILRELKGMGISIALDDFGTGYSSLSYLLKFPFDKLKIDRSFISSIETDDVARNVLEAIARLGNVLDLKVTAEGVETTDQLDALADFKCTHFQGFLFGKPLAQADLAAYLLAETGEKMTTRKHSAEPEVQQNAV